jgi:hypothetical protein
MLERRCGRGSCMGISFLISVQVFPHITNRINSEHVVVSQKYEMRWNLHHPGGQGRFKRLVLLLQNYKNRDFSIKFRNVIQSEILLTFVW